MPTTWACQSKETTRERDGDGGQDGERAEGRTGGRDGETDGDGIQRMRKVGDNVRDG